MKLDPRQAQFSPLEQAASEARDWLLRSAAPLWSTCGRTRSGLFAERMTLAAEPDASYFRLFVQARHIFSFVTIGGMGWQGPWRELVAETVDTLLRNAKRPDGFFVHRIDADAMVIDERADLYDQAFVLLALGTAGDALGRDDLFDEAEALLDVIETEWKHPLGGFNEGEIANARVRRQNPHMHLFEAFLALSEASDRQRFADAAHSIAELASRKFFDERSGALLEYFTVDLQPAPGLEGRTAEPGHCFEWAWLFERLAAAGWGKGVEMSDRLTRFARGCGIDPVRGVAINEVLTDGAAHDSKARLWPQTERLKAAISRLRRTGSDTEAGEAVAACRGLHQYLEVPVQGLWRDKLKKDGTWVDELAPGSSLYHISCAYAELVSAVSS
jgi:mannose/cellobiose epimerase-like protein (N-acyl-D-glucosamine 2-epimerase family)